MQNTLNIAVIGAGLMGHGIAQVFAAAGHQVAITDTSAEVLAAAPAYIAHNLEQMGLATDPVLARIERFDQLADTVKHADLVIEAALEKVDLKQRIFAELAKFAPAHAILASNTSVIPISDIGLKLDDAARSRVVGTHWWNPPHLVPLVEVIRTPFTSDEVFEKVFGILESVGKCPVKVNKDVPGFIGNRLQHALWREAISLVERGVCDAQTIDTVVKQSFGMRLPVLGPMENADLVGLPLAQDIHRLVFPDLDCSKTSSPLLDKLIAQGHTGMRAGAGFQTWTDEEANEVRRRLALHLIKVTRG